MNRCFLFETEKLLTKKQTHISFLYLNIGFCPSRAGIRTPAIFFHRCTTQVKLPFWQCPRIKSAWSKIDVRIRPFLGERRTGFALPSKKR